MSKHIVISNEKGTVRYVADSTTMLKSALPEKTLRYLDVMPKAKSLHLYTDQIEWLRKTASINGMTHSNYSHNTYHQLACEVLKRTERYGISIIPLERES